MRRKIFALLLMPLLSFAGKAEENYIKNSSFEQATAKQGINIPSHWWGSGVLDSKNFYSGKSSLCLKQTRKGWQVASTAIYFPAPLKDNMNLWFSFYLKSKDVLDGSVICKALDAKGKMLKYFMLKRFRRNSDWKFYKKQVAIPAGTKQIRFSFRLNGLGQAWLDDVSAGKTPAKEIDKKKVTIISSSFEKGIGAWRKYLFPALETTAEVKVVPNGCKSRHALSVKWKSGGAKCGASIERSAVLPETSYQLKGMVWAGKGSSGSFQVNIYDAANKLLEQLESPASSVSEWQEIKLNFSFPAQAKRFEIICVNKGQGEVLFDDVLLASTNVRLSSSSFPLDAYCMPVESNRIWSDNKAIFHTFASMPCSLTFAFKGQKKSLKNAELVIELPEELEIVSAFNNHPSILFSENPSKKPVVHEGKKYNAWIFTNPKVFGIVKPRWWWGRELTLGIVPKNTKSVNKEFPVFWYLKNNGRKSKINSFVCKVLPDLKNAAKPENFPVVPWGCRDLDFQDSAVLASAAKKYELANMNYRQSSLERYSSAQKVDRQLKQNGWKLFSPFWDLTAIRDYQETKKYFNKDWDSIKPSLEFVQKYDKTLKKSKLCPQFFIENPAFKKYFEKHFSKFLELKNTRNGDMVILDTEPWQPMEWCFCERCRKAFARENKISKVPAYREIISKYSEQWRDFRSRQTAEITRLCSDVVRKYYPASLVADYDYVVDFRKKNYQNTFKSVAKNPLLNEAYLDLHFPSYYYYHGKNALELMEVNSRKLQKATLPMLAIDKVGYLNTSDILNDKQFRLKIISAAVAGCKGIGIYPGEYIDAVFFSAIHKAVSEIAVVERYYQKGKKTTLGVESEVKPFMSRKMSLNGKVKEISEPDLSAKTVLRAHRLKKDLLLTLFNFSDKYSAYFNVSLKLPAGRYELVSAKGNVRYVSNKKNKFWTAKELTSFLIKVPKEDVVFLELSPVTEGNTEINDVVSQEEIEKSFQSECRRYRNSKEEVLTPQSANGMSIGYDDFDNDQNPEIAVVTPSQKVCIDYLCGGTISGWVVKKHIICGNPVYAKEKRSLAWDYFWLPKELRHNGSEKAKVKVESANILEDRVVVVLRNTINKYGITLIKKISVFKNEPSIEIDYKLTSTKSVPGISFWSHNFTENGEQNRRENIRLFVDTANGIMESPEQRTNIIYPVNPKVHKGFPKSFIGNILKGKSGWYLNGRKAGVVVGIDISKTMMIYICRGEAPTLEWMYSPVTVAPGKDWTTKVKFNYISDIGLNDFKTEILNKEK